MGLSERLSKARAAIVKAFGAGGENDTPGPEGRTLHHVEGTGDEESRIAKLLLGAFRDQVVKQGKAIQRQAVFSGKQGLYPPIDFNIFDQMHEQTSWVRAVVGVITKAVTAKGWALRPLSPDADPAHADELKAFFSNPNPQDTLVEILDDITRDCFVFGNAFTEVVYGAQGKPRELWTLDAPTLRLRVDKHGLILGYVQAQIGQQEVEFEPREVMHFKLGTKGSCLFGLSPLASLILPVTVDKFAQIYNRAFFLNGAKVRGAFIMKDSTPEQVERNREYLKERAKDLDLAHSDLILEGAVEVKQVGSTQKDMEFLSLREFTRNEILAVYGVPPAMVSIIETGNIGAGTGETQRQNFYEETILPFQYRVAEKITKQVIRGGFNYQDWAFEFNRRTIDEKEQAEILNIYLQAGVLKPEEVRPIVLSRLPEIRKAWGAAPAMGAEETPEEMVKALRGAAETITDATRSVIQLENRFLESLRGHFGKLARAMEARLPGLKAEDVKSALQKGTSGFEESPIAHGILRFTGWRPSEALKAVPELEGILEVVEPGDIARIIERFSLEAARKGLSVSARRSKVEEPDDISLALEEAVRKNAVVVAANVSEAIKSSIRRELVAGIEANETVPQLRDRIAARLESFVTVQVKGATDAAGNVIQSPYERTISNADAAEIIARTEANRAYNLGTLDALEQNDVQEVTFLLASDACPVCREVSHSSPGSKTGRKFSIEEARSMVPVHPNCFPGHTPIFTPEGWKKISQIRVGDDVLTHQLRFRKVVNTLVHAHDGPMVRMAYYRSHWRGDLACTPNHRFLTPEGQWREACEIKTGDSLLILANKCCACGNLVPYWRRYCSKRCVAVEQWRNPDHRRLVSEKARAQLLREYAEGTRDGQAIVQKAHEAVRRLVALGLFPEHLRRYWETHDHSEAMTPEVREKIRQAKLGANNPMWGMKGPLHPGWRGGKIRYRGNDWAKTCRSVKERDGFRCTACGVTEEESIRLLGTTLQVHHLIPFRIKPANDTQWLATLCARCHSRIEGAVNRLLYNDMHEYRTMAVSVLDVETFTPSRPMQVYNLEVAEDESYIAKGFVAHNCRCTWIVEGP